MRGANSKVRLERLNRLKPGDTLPVTVKLHKRGDRVVLFASECDGNGQFELEELLEKPDPVLLSVRITKKNKNSLWFSPASERFDSVAGIVEIDQHRTAEGDRQRAFARKTKVGDLILVRALKLRCPRRRWWNPWLIASLQLVREEDATKNWIALPATDSSGD